MTQYRIVLSNSAGELDSFEFDTPSPESVAEELVARLEHEWTILADGDQITVHELSAETDDEGS
jgi:hypothetical protein